MKDVFLDTVGMIVVWDETDQWHESSQTAYEQMLRAARRLVTTPLVLYECGNAPARRTYRPDVCELRNVLIEGGLLIEPSALEIEQAWAAYERGGAAYAGIVDHVSFVVMRRLGITEAFTNDKHFRAAGFTLLF